MPGSTRRWRSWPRNAPPTTRGASAADAALVVPAQPPPGVHPSGQLRLPAWDGTTATGAGAPSGGHPQGLSAHPRDGQGPDLTLSGTMTLG
ncbi:hypothetical protein GCM10010270_64180 [Streptomyces violaceus]|nr:hypothetical protein GCM10010270_64180 [Streptomyces janthinus]